MRDQFALALVLVVLTLLLLQSMPTSYTLTVNADTIDVSMRWIRYINPTDYEDRANGVCIFGDNIAIVGDAAVKPYVALLSKNDGNIVKEWIGDERGELINCISIGKKLYAVGRVYIGYDDYGLIYVFDENLNVVASTIKKSSAYRTLAYDGEALIIGGWTLKDLNGDGYLEPVWIVEKRDPNSLSPIASREMYFGSWIGGWIHDIGVEPSTGMIWAVGFYEDSDRRPHSLIILLDRDLKILKIIDYTEGDLGHLFSFYGIAFDGEGHVYVSGWYGVAKFSLDGNLITVNKDYRLRWKIVYGYGHVYTFVAEEAENHSWHVLYVHDSNLNIVERYVLSKNVYADSHFYVGRPALEEGIIYVAGYDYALGGENSRVVVYAIELPSASTGIQRTQTENLPETAITCSTVVMTKTVTSTFTTHAPITTTIRETTTATFTSTVVQPTTVTTAIEKLTTVTVTNWASVVTLAVVLFVIGVAVGYAIKKR